MASETASYVEHEREFLERTRELPGRVSALSTQDAGPERYGWQAEKLYGVSVRELCWNVLRDERQAEIRRLETELVEAKRILSDMEMEVRGMSPATRRALGSKIRAYNESLSSVQSDLNRAKERYSRSALLSGGGRGLQFNDASLSQRDRASQALSRMETGTSRLEDGRRMLAETEDVAYGITTELQRNRETLDSARRKVGDVNSQTNMARRILRSMDRRELRYKIFLVIFILVVLTLIGVVLYYAFRGKK